MNTLLEIGKVREEIKALEKEATNLPRVIREKRGIDVRLTELRKTEKLLLLQLDQEKKGIYVNNNSETSRTEFIQSDDNKKLIGIAVGVVGLLTLSLIVVVIVKKMRK